MKKRLLAGAVILALALNLAGSWYFSLSPWTLDKALLRMALDWTGSILYADDLAYVRKLQLSYLRGVSVEGDPVASWKKLEKEHPELVLLSYSCARTLSEGVPFVYQVPERSYLRELAGHHRLAEIAGGGDEYEAMLRVFRWLGTRWDHGADPVPGGHDPLSPELVLESGARGGKYWCEISAKLAVETASALGWPARLVTASRNGHRWEHAVAEVWSNRFNKWFLVDTDFNVLYEAGGVPLSAFELCHDGPGLKRQGRLKVRRIAPAKKSLKARDLLPFYRYVHIDLRNDWSTRPLRPLSPAGGDASTWWTARPDLGPIPTAKQRVDDRGRFDWKLHEVQVVPLGVRQGKGRGMSLELGLRSYSPFFARFELYHNGVRHESDDGRVILDPSPGVNLVTVRVVDRQGRPGPSQRLSFTARQP